MSETPREWTKGVLGRRLDRIPEEIIEEIRERADIVEVVSREVSLKRSGTSYKGLCPFHEEKTPSFHVFPESGRYKCFGCGEGGNVFRFMMERMGMRFLDALEELSRETGVALPQRERTPEEAEREKQRASIRDALTFAASYYRELLRKHPAGEEARRYLADRGFTEQTLEEFGVGYARDAFDGDRSLLGYATGKGISVQALEAAGLVRTNERGKRYDFFRGRIMFPIRDWRGRVIGFGARILDRDGPKYLNSPDTLLFGKSRELYGQDLARAAAHGAGRVLVVEGYTDVMHCRQAGFPETVAGLGTALTVENARNLRRMGAPVVLLYDGDDAGLAAAERGADVLLGEEVDASVAILPAGEDPADLLVREGPGALEDVLNGAQSLLDYRVQRLAARYDFTTVEGGHKAAREMLEVVARIRDSVRQDLALRLLSERLGVSESSLRGSMRKPPGRAKPPSGSAPKPAPAPAAPAELDEAPSDAVFREGWDEPEQKAPPKEISPAVRMAERRFLEAALVEAEMWDRIVAAYPPEKFEDSAFRSVADAVHTLRQGGESVTRDALAGILADSDAAIRALDSLQPVEGAGERASQDLERILHKRKLDQALRAQSLADVVRARGGGLEQSS